MISKSTSKMMRGIAIIIVLLSHLSEWLGMYGYGNVVVNQTMTWGPVGVDIFFLMSGYAMVKSAASEYELTGRNHGITLRFVLKRVVSVYIPYLIIYLILELVSGNLSGYTKDNWIDFFSGHHYWFLSVLFIMYILFMIVWRVGNNRLVNAFVVGALVVALTGIYYISGRADFWQLSNMAFVIGIFLAVIELEKKELLSSKVINIMLGVSLGLFAAFTIWLNMTALYYFTRRFIIEFVMGIFFTLFIYALSTKIDAKEKNISGLIGEYTLFIYVIHDRFVWKMVENIDNVSPVIVMILSLIVAIAIGCIIGYLYNKYVVRKLIK